ncbi:MAG: hypothetical protein KDC85_11635 [Saprospiraceae bacterium]|nr:hypothetical protein [Saprospiraceae bacterium]MCB9323153.1 hypothetical protein [Lewinellaceae bacterium]
MKRILLFLTIVVFSSNSLSAQEFNEEEIRKDVSQYFQYNEKNQMDSLINMLIPEFVEMFSREFLKSQMEELVDNANFKVRFRDMKMQEIQNALQSEESSYALVDYEFIMEFGFQRSEYQDPADFDSFLQFMETSFKSQYGETEVSLDKEKSAILVAPHKTILAVKKPGYDSWKFIDFEPQNMEMYKTLFGKSVMEKLETIAGQNYKDD